MLDFGEADSAIAEIHEALRLKPNEPNYLDSLGQAQLARGDLKQALATFHEASRLLGDSTTRGVGDPTRTEIQAHLRHAERLATLQGRLDSILRGEDVPADAEGKLDVAELCRVTRRFAAASKFYREAFQAKPALAEDLSSQNRLHAAIAAAQAGTQSNPAKDDLSLNDVARARWRAQALEWLRAERNSCAKLLAQGVSAQRDLARKTFDILRHHRELAALRDEAGLKQLPEDERKGWQMFWAEVNALLAKAEGGSS